MVATVENKFPDKKGNDVNNEIDLYKKASINPGVISSMYWKVEINWLGGEINSNVFVERTRATFLEISEHWISTLSSQ